MTHYSNEPENVRVDFFKPSGKWYATEAVPWKNYKGCIHQVFKQSLTDFLQGRYVGMTAVCLDPYHEHSHPLMLVNIG